MWGKCAETQMRESDIEKLDKRTVHNKTLLNWERTKKRKRKYTTKKHLRGTKNSPDFRPSSSEFWSRRESPAACTHPSASRRTPDHCLPRSVYPAPQAGRSALPALTEGFKPNSSCHPVSNPFVRERHSVKHLRALIFGNQKLKRSSPTISTPDGSAGQSRPRTTS